VARQSSSLALASGAFFGLAAYAAFDLTGLALLDRFPVAGAVVDLVWGVPAGRGERRHRGKRQGLDLSADRRGAGPFVAAPVVPGPTTGRDPPAQARRIFSMALPFASSSISLSRQRIFRISGSSTSSTRTPHTTPLTSALRGSMAGA